MPLWTLELFDPEEDYKKSKSALKAWKVRRERQRERVHQIAVEVASRINANPVSVLMPATKEDK